MNNRQIENTRKIHENELLLSILKKLPNYVVIINSLQEVFYANENFIKLLR